MNLSRFEKRMLVECPLFFGMVLIISGVIVSFGRPQILQGLILIGSGLVCTSIYCVCALMAKIIESK